MSGIAGVYYLDGRAVDRADVDRMVERIAHRGPDASGVWSEGAVGLGHRMLWTTPESLGERLPLVNKSGDLALTADARIDNRDELMGALGLNGRLREKMGDSELILRAYEQWGERCSEKLLGDFAFVIWDARKPVLFCARDHFGVKPFYYHHSGRAFVFASEIKALLCLREVPRRLNETRVADYLMGMLEDKAITFYQEIFRLPPGHSLTVGCENVQLRPYWSLDPSRELRLGSDEEYAEAFRELFTEAVRCRLRSAFPVGSMLSGGLDSSSIVCVARKLLAQDGKSRLHTFSAIFDNVPECDERPFINAVLAQGSLEAHYVRGDQLSPLGDLDWVLENQDEAFYAPNLFLHVGLYRAAKRHGVRVLLDGIDGDTTVSHGIMSLAELARTGRWIALATEVNALSGHFGDSPWSVFVRFGLKPLAPDLIRRAWRALRQGIGLDGAVNRTIRADFGGRIGLRERTHALLGDRSMPPRTQREDHWRSLTRGLVPLYLEVADRAAAALSIEPRYPFFHRRLVEFCLALPPSQKLHRGWTRVVMRRALAHLLPEEVRLRGGKSNLGSNFTRGLLTFDQALLEDVVLNRPQAIEEYVDMAALRSVYHKYVSERAENDGLTVWRAVTLALWLQRTNLSRHVSISQSKQ